MAQHLDFPEMKRTQEELQAAYEEVRAANAAKSDFLSRMSHDIRTPMNGILGMVEVARHNLDDRKKLEEALDKISIAGNYLLDIINDVLDMNKLESGNIELAHEPFHLLGLMHEVIQLLEIQAQEKKVTFHLDGFDRIEHTELLGSPQHVKRIFTNIMSNAVKFNKPGGNVTVRIRETGCESLNVDAIQGMDVGLPIIAHFHFEIEDTGIGMHEDYVEHVFEPFVQEYYGARSNYGGTGLGMSIAKALTEAMSGSISVRSMYQVGTTFSIDLAFEVNQADTRQEREAGLADLSFAGKRALVVEDNELNAEIAQFMLEELGFSVELAADGRRGVDCFQFSERDYYDVIFMDIMMPNMDGLEATKTIRRFTRADAMSIPIIAMTANAFTEDVRSAIDAGMNEHLAKPLEMEKLKRALVRWL